MFQAWHRATKADGAFIDVQRMDGELRPRYAAREGYPLLEAEWLDAGFRLVPLASCEATIVAEAEADAAAVGSLMDAAPAVKVGDRVMIRPWRGKNEPWFPAVVDGYFGADKHLNATLIFERAAKWTVRHESSGEGACWREPTAHEVAQHWPSAAPTIPSTFADVRVGQRWRWVGDTFLQGTEWIVDHIGVVVHRLSEAPGSSRARKSGVNRGEMTPENFEDSNWKCIGEAPVEAKPPYLPPVVTPVRLTAHIEGEKCVAVTTEPGVPAWSTGDVAEACGGKGKPF